MRFHPEWRQILARAWCVRFILTAAGCDAVALGVTFFTDAAEPWRSVLAAAGMVATIGAAVARLLPQGDVPGAAS